MHLEKVPQSTARGAASDAASLALLLGEAVDTEFACSDIIFGGPSSGRILYQHTNAEGVTLPFAYTADDMAAELMNFADTQARYPDEGTGKKGWQISSFTDSEGSSAFIAWAIWM